MTKLGGTTISDPSETEAMIDAGLEFEGTHLVERLALGLAALPAPFKPSYFHDDEIPSPGKRYKIADEGNYIAKLTNNKLGFFLSGPGTLYNLRNTRGGHVVCECSLKFTSEIANQFLSQIIHLKPIFAYACSWEERVRRIQIIVRIDTNTIESWVDRDVMKYVPGFYWQTFLSEDLVKRHAIPLADVEAVAREHIECEGGGHLLQFYDRPEQWLNTPAVDQLCASIPGVFDIERIRPLLSGAKNYLELHAILSKWR